MDDREAFLIAFVALVAVTYLKGAVRVDTGQLFSSIVFTAPLSALLFEYGEDSPFVLRTFVFCLACAFALTGIRSGIREGRKLLTTRLSVLEEIIRPDVEWQTEWISPHPPSWYRDWCNSRNPLTVGICFVPEDYRIQAIQFIRSNANPEELLYSGTIKHDKIFANDMLIYFATERLPITKWAHFDPHLQDSRPIQEEMIREFERKRPLYIVLWDIGSPESNDSSKSSGVTLLDDYIQKEYEPVPVFFSSVFVRKKLTPGF